MKKIIYTCDRCKKEITGDLIKICMETVDRESGDFSTVFPFPDIREYDFCKSCADFIAGQIRRFCKKGVPAIINEDFDNAVKEMIATSQSSPPPVGQAQAETGRGKDCSTQEGGMDCEENSRGNELLGTGGLQCSEQNESSGA